MPKRKGIMDYRKLADDVADEIFCGQDLSAEGVLYAIAQERKRQDEKWGPQDHDQMIWLGILAEEFGEAAKEINELHFRPGDEVHIDDLHLCKPHRIERVRKELIQVAAVAVAMVETLDRNGR